MGQKQWGGLASKLAATPLLLSHTIGVKPVHDYFPCLMGWKGDTKSFFE